MRSSVITGALGIALMLWIGVSAQQEMLPKPGPGSGITRVSGEVNISNIPEVKISNIPEVRVLELPPLSIASPPFARKGGTYTITWSDGGTENVIVAEVGPDGWVRAEAARHRWINLRTARAVEER